MDLKITCNTDLEEKEESAYELKTKILHDISEDCTLAEVLKELKLKVILWDWKNIILIAVISWRIAQISYPIY